MGLSKDNTDIIEELKSIEITAAQKRRLRRKKLKAARAESSDADSTTQKDSHPLQAQLSKSIAKPQGNGTSKKQKHKCEGQGLNQTQNSVSRHTAPSCNLKCERTTLSNDLTSPSQNTISKKNSKSIPKNTKNQELSNYGPHIIINHSNSPKLDSTGTIVETKTKCQKLTTNKKQKSKPNGNQVKPEKECLTEDKTNKSVNSLIIDNQTGVNQRLKENQTIVSQGLHINENKSPVLNTKCEINNYLLSDADQVLTKKQTGDSLESRTKNATTSEKLNLESPKPKPQKPEFIENVISVLENRNMGKIADPPESHKKQEVSKTEVKKEDTSSNDASAKSREDIKAAREAKKLAKQKAKKKDDTTSGVVETKVVPKSDVQTKPVKDNAASNKQVSSNKLEKNRTPETVDDLKSKENIPPIVTDKAECEIKNLSVKPTEDVKSDTPPNKTEEAAKSKAELRAERRAKQEAQRAAKQESLHATKPVEQKTAPEMKDKEPIKSKEEKSPKSKTTEKSKSKTQSMQKVGWLQHLCVEKDKTSLNNIPINSNLHPAVVKLGVQLAAGVVTGSNARCIALLDAIKKMVRDYSLPARTEVGRGLQAQLAAAEAYLWARRAPAAAETNALKHFRRQLTQLPANIDEFDAKKQLQQEIDRYIREQIDMAGEAISLILRNKISPGDHILTYGCSSLIERVLCSAWAAGVRFRATVAGARGQRGPEMLRRLRARGVPASYVDISALSYVMADVQKVVLGAGALLAHGGALGAAGSAAAALLARAANVPVLVACETHKFSGRTDVDPLVSHEIGDPDDLIDKTDDSSPVKDWRSNPNLTLLNVTYDVTPPALITAVVTELGILPCTSAPVVLRFKQSEYGM